ncbi:hypothetical protein SAMN02745225_01051 [Ferrithrix thermotolerans DSM 19514]|uniref:Membrane protein YfhO n=1 Tax=Ferrithrix thermotolerans DSM 19514 TaxID=1121881 RepID=A0A1M4UP06_9ACTN|nr:hypothetical protein [Ferrithrix thermotolerans]SHE58387.1 hypothetical protein SAMN02745225_01051 [Ferrithrix thermotolerans DSM 19514]
MAKTISTPSRVLSSPLVWIFTVDLAIYLIPLALGDPLIYGDNLNQNLPLRAMAGAILAKGHLPTWDKFNWAGEPLLAGFNAGVFFPLTWLFIFLPPSLAMSLNVALTFFLASTGVYLTVRQLGGSKTASVLSALVFTFTGQFASQSVHIDMIEGIAGSIWMLYFVLRFFKQQTISLRMREAAFFGISFSLVVLAGAPEAMIDGLIMCAVVSFVLLLSDRDKARTVALFATAGVLALLLSSIQWIPGLLFEALSNRAKTASNFFEAGPYSPYFLPTFISPFLFGNYGSLGVVSYFSSYNLAEISTYLPPIVTVVGATTLFSAKLGSISNELRRAFLAALAVAVVLALGTYLPPFEFIMAHVPLYNLQRLPSRNMYAVDLILTLSFGASFDKLASKALVGVPIKVKPRVLLALVSVISLLSATLALALLVSPLTLFRALDVPAPYPVQLGGLQVLVTVGATLSIIALVALVVSIYTDRVTLARDTFRIALFVTAFQIISYAGQTLIGQIPQSGPYGNHAEFTKYTPHLPGDERSVIFDPYLFYYSNLLKVGLPDLNYLQRQLSAQGYASLGIAGYNNVTNSKLQGSINPYILDSFGVRDLNITRLTSGSKYFLSRLPKPNNPTNGQPPITYVGSNLQAIAKTSGEKEETSSFYLGSPTVVTYVGIKVPLHTTASCIKGAEAIGVWGTQQLSQRVVEGGYVFFETPFVTQPAYEIRLQTCGKLETVNGSPYSKVVIDSGENLFELNGWLSHVVTPMLYSYTPGPNGLSIFTYRHPHRSLIMAPKGARITSVRQSLDGSITFDAVSKAAFTAVVSQAYTSGWKAYYSSAGKIHTLKVGQYRSLQTVTVPPGATTVTLSYTPPGLTTAETLFGVGLALTVALLFLSLTSRVDRLKPTMSEGGTPFQTTKT